MNYFPQMVLLYVTIGISKYSPHPTSRNNDLSPKNRCCNHRVSDKKERYIGKEGSGVVSIVIR